MELPPADAHLGIRRTLMHRHPARRLRETRTGIGLQRGILSGLILALLAALGAAPGPAAAAPRGDAREQMQGLDEQVQEIKSEVLSIAAELKGLEERLLYPSDTQVALFVSLAEEDGFRLDSVRIQLDGELVAHHIYSFKELEALKKGGVQRIHTGNLATGEHRLEVSVAGKLPGGGDLAGTESFTFRKEVGPKLVGITLGGKDSGAARIRIGGW